MERENGRFIVFFSVTRVMHCDDAKRVSRLWITLMVLGFGHITSGANRSEPPIGSRSGDKNSGYQVQSEDEQDLRIYISGYETQSTTNELTYTHVRELLRLLLFR